MQRSLHDMRELNLSANDITDKGVEKLLHRKYYPASLQILDLSVNVLGAMAAYHISCMFEEKRNSALHTLILGGKVGKKGWGDDFARVLVGGLLFSTNGKHRLKELHMPDANLTRTGVDCMTAYLSCDRCALQFLNLSRNAILDTQGATKSMFLNALRANSSLVEVFVRECGIVPADVTHMQHAVKTGKAMPLVWNEAAKLAYKVASTSSVCQHMHDREYRSSSLDFKKPKPDKFYHPPYLLKPEVYIRYIH